MRKPKNDSQKKRLFCRRIYPKTRNGNCRKTYDRNKKLVQNIADLMKSRPEKTENPKVSITLTLETQKCEQKI